VCGPADQDDRAQHILVRALDRAVQHLHRVLDDRPDHAVQVGAVDHDRRLPQPRRRRDRHGHRGGQPLLRLGAGGPQRGERGRVLRQFAQLGGDVLGEQVVEQGTAEHVRAVGVRTQLEPERAPPQHGRLEPARAERVHRDLLPDLDAVGRREGLGGRDRTGEQCQLGEVQFAQRRLQHGPAVDTPTHWVGDHQLAGRSALERLHAVDDPRHQRGRE
jgi:hypothetical protein